MKEKGFAPIIMVIALLVLAGIVGVIYFGTGIFGTWEARQFKGGGWSALYVTPILQPTKSPITHVTQTENPISIPASSQTDPTENWEVYTNDKLGFQIKLPSTYKVTKDEPNLVQISLINENIGGIYSYINISKLNNTDYSTYPACKEGSKWPCLNGKTSWNQSAEISDTQLDGKKAKSIYFTEGPDGDFHTIQTTELPTIQIKMLIAGGGLDRTFNQILSTFKFTDQSNAEGRVCGGPVLESCPDGYTCQTKTIGGETSGTCTKNPKSKSCNNGSDCSI